MHASRLLVFCTWLWSVPAFAADLPPPAPLLKVHADQGFIDDAVALSPDGTRVAYMFTDGERGEGVIETLGMPTRVKFSLAGLPPTIAKLRFSPDGKYLLVVGDDREKDCRVAQLYAVDGTLIKGRLGPATDFEMTTVGGAPTIMSRDVKAGKKSTTFTFTAYGVPDLKVKKKKAYVTGDQGLIRGLDLRLVSYADGYQHVVGQRKGEFDKKNDVRKPENIAFVEALSGKILSQTEITDPIAWAELAKARSERETLEAFVMVEEMKSAVLVTRDHRRVELKLPVPVRRYEPKSLVQELVGGTLYLGLALDPVNPDATAKGKTDRPDMDLYRVDATSGQTDRLFRLESDRPLAFTTGKGRVAVLRKFKNFSRGGVDLEIYPLPGAP